MPLREQIPDEVIESVVHMLKAYEACSANAPSRRWLDHMLGQACRHIEYFVKPRTSVAALAVWKLSGASVPLCEQPYRKPGGWYEGADLYFEHAVPANDLKFELIGFGAAVDAATVRRVLSKAEIAWITRDEERQLRAVLKGLPKGLRSDWRAVYEAAGIKMAPHNT